jgi:hypothetical protein
MLNESTFRTWEEREREKRKQHLQNSINNPSSRMTKVTFRDHASKKALGGVASILLDSFDMMDADGQRPTPQEVQLNSINKIMKNRLNNDEGEHFLSINVQQPHVSMIVDKPITFVPGTVLFTARLGPIENNWKPYGYEKDSTQQQFQRRTSLINRNVSLLDIIRPTRQSASTVGGDSALYPSGWYILLVLTDFVINFINYVY